MTHKDEPPKLNPGEGTNDDPVSWQVINDPFDRVSQLRFEGRLTATGLQNALADALAQTLDREREWAYRNGDNGYDDGQSCLGNAPVRGSHKYASFNPDKYTPIPDDFHDDETYLDGQADI